MNEEMKDILQVLGFDDDDEFKLHVVEAITELTLMIHWLRGLFSFLKFHKIIGLSGERENNYNRLLDNISDYEKHIWEHMPGRAMMVQLMQYRRGKELHKDYTKLLNIDAHGRFPENELSREEFLVLDKIVKELSGLKQRDKS